jgi:1-acyl-sn-glycerol-3-phosphate acyltransferase
MQTLHGPADPDRAPDPDSQLSTVERVALAVCRFANEDPRGKAIQGWHHRWLGNPFVRAAVRRRLHIHGLEHVTGLRPDRGVLLCSNHRSFFDQYILMSVLYDQADWPRRVYFPVRSNFFYEAWTGLLINGLIGGFVMYPPIFRDASCSDENKLSLDRLTAFLGDPGVVVGMHPEGTRGKGADPYQLLPAQPGVGQMIMRGRPIVLPAFINGVSNSVAHEFRMSYGPRARREREQIHIVFGPPVELGALLEGKPRPAQYKRVADKVLGEIAKLGTLEREKRAAGVSSAGACAPPPGPRRP